ncbi:MAG: hypothetical protein JWO73_452 [Candidatus Taylorbacteria bacterium]|nr:hypothetical protein [Candidatus Taylorbacteria bacterium]
MLELITGMSMLASTVALNSSVTGTVTSTAMAATTTSATTTAIIQTIDANSPVGRSLSYRQKVQEYFKNEPILIEVARCESEFRQFKKDGTVIRGIVNNQDVGIMQINEKYHLAASKALGYDIYSVEGNLAYARYIYEEQGAAPWVSSSPCWSKAEPLAVR